MAILKIEGRLTPDATRSFKAFFIHFLENKPVEVAFDLSEFPSPDAHGIGALTEAAQALQKQGVPVIFAGARIEVIKALEQMAGGAQYNFMSRTDFERVLRERED